MKISVTLSPRMQVSGDVMLPSVVVSYVDAKKGRVAKAAFVNTTDALTYWNALPEKRRRHLAMHTLEGEDITEIAHAGWNDAYGYYGHATALTLNQPLPSYTRDRSDAERQGWEFVAIEDAKDG